MKTIKFITALLLTVMFSSCAIIDHDYDPYYRYYLFLNIRNASGVNLVRELALHELNIDFRPTVGGYLGIRPEFYTLEAVYPDKMMDPRQNQMGAVFYTPPEPHLEFTVKEGIYYLTFEPNTSWGQRDKTKPAPWITYQLTCPSIFGDDEVHEIITYWKTPSKKPKKYQVCYRIEYSGMIISDITAKQHDQLYYATIQLEK